MPTKIPVNGFGRIGKMLAMAQTWPYLMEGQRRMMTRSMKVQELREIEKADRRHGLDREAQTYALIRKPDNSYVFHPPESAVTDAVVDTSDLPNARYHDRTFPKDYAKKKKAKRRQQKQARRRKIKSMNQ
jgi:hypothetical protein